MTTGLLLKDALAWVGSISQKLKESETRWATIASVMSGVSGQAVLMVSGILAARILGVDGRGYLAMLTVFVAIVSQVGGLGVPQAATFYISKTKRAGAILRQLWPLMIAQSLLLLAIHLIVVLVYIQGVPGEVKIAALYTLFATPGSLARVYGQGILQGQGRFRLFNILRLLPVVSYTILLVFLFAAAKGELPKVAAVWSISNLLTGLLALFLACADIGDDILQPANIALPSRKEMTCFGLKGLFGWSSPLNSFRIDHLIAGLMLSSGALGLYVVGQAFTNLPMLISQSIGMIAYPTISGKEDTRGIKRLIWRFILITAALNSFIVVLLWLAMPLLIRLFFGNAFIASTPLARILIIGALLVSLRRIIVECARGLGRPEISSYAELSMYPWLIISIPILVFSFGITGMAISVASGQLVSLLVSILFAVRIFYWTDHATTMTATKGSNWNGVSKFYN